MQSFEEGWTQVGMEGMFDGDSVDHSVDHGRAWQCRQCYRWQHPSDEPHTSMTHSDRRRPPTFCSHFCLMKWKQHHH